MKISFVIPAHNEEHLIGPCVTSVIESLRSFPFQSEIIVVDNASTDKTAEIARTFPGVQVVSEARKGLTFARQAGFEASSGNLIANIDADTMISPNWITYAHKQFETNATLVALSGPFIYYDLPWYQRVATYIFYFFGYIIHLINQHIFKTGAMVQGGNFVLRRSALEEIGGFDTSISFYGEDTDIAKRISKFGTVKWTFNFPIRASGRRIMEEGIVRMGIRYALNYLWTTYIGKPFTNTYTDIRITPHN